MGLEPTISTLRVRCATHCATPPSEFTGGKYKVLHSLIIIKTLFQEVIRLTRQSFLLK